MQAGRVEARHEIRMFASHPLAMIRFALQLNAHLPLPTTLGCRLSCRRCCWPFWQPCCRSPASDSAGLHPPGDILDTPHAHTRILRTLGCSCARSLRQTAVGFGAPQTSWCAIALSRPCRTLASDCRPSHNPSLYREREVLNSLFAEQCKSAPREAPVR